MDPGSPSYGTSDGSCGYGDLSKTAYPFWSVAALSTQNQFYLAGPANGCGECFEIQCLNSGGQFAIAPMLNGRIDIQYRRVECTPPVPVKVQIDGNSGTGGWLRLAVTTNSGSGGVKTVQVKGPNSGWQGLSNTFGAEWELPNQPSLPIDLHIISDSGQEITAYGVITTSGQTGTVSTNQQFAFSGAPSYSQASSIGSTSSSPSSEGTPASSSSGSSSSSTSVIQSAVASAGPAASAGGGQVSAYDGPASSSSSSSSCNDIAPGSNTCAQQKGWGKCNSGFMTATGSSTPHGFCAKTCGRC
ncbi:TPA: expansin [Trebouxia sp. C0005]